MPDDTPSGHADDSVPDCVADLMVRGYDESSAYAICKDAIEGDAAAAVDTLLDTILERATPLAESEFDAETLDLVAETDILVRAAADDMVVWTSPDGGVAYRAQRGDAKAEEWGAEMFYVRPAEDDDTEYNGDLLGIGVDFPESDVYVDWKRDAFPTPLDDPHVSIYGSVEDLEQATGNDIEYISEYGLKADTDAEDIELPTECRLCGDNRRMEGNMVCPECHPEVDADNGDHNLVGEKAAGERLSMKGPATALADSPAAPADITKAGTNEIDLDALPEEYQAALEADDFVIYGKASIEQWDDDDVPTLIEMDALEGALDRFFESDQAPGIISRYHQDIPVGRPIREYELDSDVTLNLATPDDEPETHEFEAGETLRTHVEDGDGDGRPELWLVSNLANDTEPAKRARLLALQGDLDGYSVTIHRNRDELTEDGRRVTKCDLHAVTLGTGEQIKNAGSMFDVAEFKAALRGRVDLAEAKINGIAHAVSSALR